MARRPLARRPKQSEESPERSWTPDSIRIALRKLRHRLTDVKAFEPETVRRRSDPQATALETSIRETLADVYGRNSRSYRNHQLAAQLDATRHNPNGVLFREVVSGYTYGKQRSIQMLGDAIRSLEKRMEDDFPASRLTK